MSTVAVVVLAIVVVAAAVLISVFWSRQKNDQLRDKYGQEYRHLARTGTPREVAREISRREKRVESFHIRPLTEKERDTFSADWQKTQARFVDDPPGAVLEADLLVADLMTARGYPVAEFEQRAADISVDHPAVVEHYRAAHAIAERHRDRKATTEELRQALVHYRALFDELLEERAMAHTEVGR